MVILYVYPCISPKKSPFWQNKYTKDGCEGKKPLHRKKPSFVYLCIGAKKSQPYSDILCLNGWTYDSLPLILVPRSFRDLYLPLYKCAKAVLSFIIIHPSVLQKLKCGNKYSLTKLKTESAKLASLPSQL